MIIHLHRSDPSSIYCPSPSPDKTPINPNPNTNPVLPSVHFPPSSLYTAKCCIFPFSTCGFNRSMGLYFCARTGVLDACPGSVFVPGYGFFSSPPPTLPAPPLGLNGLMAPPGRTAVFFSVVLLPVLGFGFGRAADLDLPAVMADGFTDVP